MWLLLGVVGLDRPGLELALEGRDEELWGWGLARFGFKPGLRREPDEADTAGLVKREDGWEVTWPLSLWAAAAATALGCSLEVVWTGVALPDAGISSSRHFFTKLLALEARVLSLALRLSSLMCLPSRVAYNSKKSYDVINIANLFLSSSIVDLSSISLLMIS